MAWYEAVRVKGCWVPRSQWAEVSDDLPDSVVDAIENNALTCVTNPQKQSLPLETKVILPPKKLGFEQIAGVIEVTCLHTECKLHESNRSKAH